MAHNNHPKKHQEESAQSLYPPNSTDRTWAAIIITILIIGAGVWAFSYLIG